MNFNKRTKIYMAVAAIVVMTISVIAASAQDINWISPSSYQDINTGRYYYDTNQAIDQYGSQNNTGGTTGTTGTTSSGATDSSKHCSASLAPAGTTEVYKSRDTNLLYRDSEFTKLVPNIIGRSGGDQIYLNKTDGSGADYDYIVGKICLITRDVTVGYIYENKVDSMRKEQADKAAAAKEKAGPENASTVKIMRADKKVYYYGGSKNQEEITGVEGNWNDNNIYAKGTWRIVGKITYPNTWDFGGVGWVEVDKITPPSYSPAVSQTATDTRDVNDLTTFEVPVDKTEVYVEAQGTVYNAKNHQRVPEAHYNISEHKLYYVKDGVVTNSGYGKMMTRTRGYINLDLRAVQNYDQQNTSANDVPAQTTSPVDSRPATPAVTTPSADVPTSVERPSRPATTSETTGTTPSAQTRVTPATNYEKPVVTAETAIANPFSDTSTSTLEGRAAAYLNQLGVIGGYPDGEFKGSKAVNRAEAAKFLLLAAGITIQDAPNNGRFWDVVDGQWYTKYVMTAASNQVINGYPDGSFGPANKVKTNEFLKMLTLAFKLKTSQPYDYFDVPESEWYAKYAGTAAQYNLFPDRNGGKLYPARELTRKEVAIAIYNYLKAEAATE